MAVRQKLKKLARRMARYYQDRPDEVAMMVTPDVVLASFWEKVFSPKNKKE